MEEKLCCVYGRSPQYYSISSVYGQSVISPKLIFKISIWYYVIGKLTQIRIAQSAGAVEYTDCTTAEG